MFVFHTPQEFLNLFEVWFEKTIFIFCFATEIKMN